MLTVLLPDNPAPGAHHVLVRVQEIHCRQVSPAIGVVELMPRITGITPGIHILRAHLGEVVPNLRARTVVETGLPQVQDSAIKDELTAFDPELPEAELLVVLVIHARARHGQPKGVEIGLAHIPEPRVGPGPCEHHGLRLRGNHSHSP